MGKGDKKSRKGKIIMGSYGKLRPKKNKVKTVETLKAEKEEKIIKPLKKPTEPKSEPKVDTKKQTKTTKPITKKKTEEEEAEPRNEE